MQSQEQGGTLLALNSWREGPLVGRAVLRVVCSDRTGAWARGSRCLFLADLECGSFRTFAPRLSPQVVLEPTGCARVYQPPQTGREDAGSGGQSLFPTVKGTLPAGSEGQARPLRGSRLPRGASPAQGTRRPCWADRRQGAAQAWGPQGMAGGRQAGSLVLEAHLPQAGLPRWASVLLATGPTRTRPPAAWPRTCPARQAWLPQGWEGPASLPDGLCYFYVQAVKNSQLSPGFSCS